MLLISCDLHQETTSSQSITSGALYHLVATYSVMNPPPPEGPASGGGLAADLANPRSQIYRQLLFSRKAGHESWYTLRSQLAFKSKLDGFRSRWRTFAEWMAFKPRIAWLLASFPLCPSKGEFGLAWYIKYWQWSFVRSCVLITRCLSISSVRLVPTKLTNQSPSIPNCQLIWSMKGQVSWPEQGRLLWNWRSSKAWWYQE